MRQSSRLVLAVALLGAAACRSAGTSYLHPNVDLAALKTVAVLPFENITQERAAADKVQKVFLTELLALGVFDVVEPGTVVKVLRAERAESADALAPADLKRIGEAVKADALFMGSVIDFADNRSGTTPAPEVTVALRLVEVQSGVTVWSMQKTRSGASLSARLFGVGGESLTDAARQLVREELRSLVK
ncbi:MAG TPA: CsgG/HfaB family protein [Vicinamibacteria bacterium]|nr:CsgG/HfaB family protein [Vicinamibacteria bacterium]